MVAHGLTLEERYLILVDTDQVDSEAYILRLECCTRTRERAAVIKAEMMLFM